MTVIRPSPRYRIVQARPPSQRRLLYAVLGAAWLGSVLLAWQWAGRIAAPRLAETAGRLDRAERQLRALRERAADLGQREATLARSDQISRQANRGLQDTLAQRDEEIAGLRADVAFYERLVGPTAQRQGLNVFSSEFAPAGGEAWKYQVVLTQNLDRGAVSAGGMRLAIEGVREGRLATLDWAQLHQRAQMPEQPYSFRYFQRLEGSVMLPEGFTPQRVRVTLQGDEVAIEREFDWKIAGS